MQHILWSTLLALTALPVGGAAADCAEDPALSLYTHSASDTLTIGLGVGMTLRLETALMRQIGGFSSVD